MKKLLLLLFIVFGLNNLLIAQKKSDKGNAAKNNSKANPDSLLLSGLNYRCIGPFRGGRSSAVTGVRKVKNNFYMGSTGGGVWKTTDGGSNWKNISDKYFGGSIGAVAVSESDNDVIYAGEGEQTLRGNVSEGFGIWKTTDGGNTWKDIGLKDTRHIVRIRIHPKNPQLVYVAALGHLFGSNEERGIYRTKDGGTTWEKILYVNDHVGAADLCMDPNNPQVLFATFWNVKRTPYSLESGGAGSSVYKSSDGGDTWKDITGNDGLPKDTLGIITVAISPVNSDRIYMMVEAKEGGLFRSDDGGETFTRINEERKIRQRAWYFSRIYADTKDENTVYVLNVEFHKSTDGGKTFKTIRTPHGDHHDFWIDPDDSKRMIIADDGGAQISFDGGDNWSTYYNQPTAQFYRVTTDNHFPYRIYGAQQDNSSLRIQHRTGGNAIYQNDWENTAGGESGYHTVDPLNDDIVYGGNYGGYLERLDHKTGESRNVNVWPDSPIGWGADTLKYRFQWNFPILFSPHDPKKLYTAGNVLFTSADEGQSWTAISPDLTRNDKSRMRASGGAITKDNTGVEYYGTIFYVCESPYEKDLLWCGSDDGLLHVSRNGGKDWTDVTPTGLPKWIMFNCIDADPFNKGGAYVAATNYKNDDFTPYLYHTTDYGKLWTKITNGINQLHFTRAIRADHKRKGLLYAGTEYGMYLSFDDGANWRPFKQNMPVVPITDMTIKDDDLILATQGRSFWIMDDITQLEQMNDSIANQKFFLFKPRDTWRMTSSKQEKPVNAGENPTPGVVINYFLQSKADTANVIKVIVMDAQMKTVKAFASNADKEEDKLKTKSGMNKVSWNMLYAEADKFEGVITWSGNGGNPFANPGKYYVKLIAGKDSVTKDFIIKKPGNITASDEDLKAQFDFMIKCRDKLSETNNAVKNIRDLRQQLNGIVDRTSNSKTVSDTLKKELKTMKDSVDKKITSIEEKLYQTKAKAGQDFLNYPVMLNDKLAELMNTVSQGNTSPSKQAQDFYVVISKAIDEQLNALKKLSDEDLKKFNEFVIKNNLPVVVIKEK
ncbi:MAG: glycosyl hydrolase [Bacteroidia bacterium]